MITLEEMILLIIMVCVVFLTVAMIIGAVFLYASVKKLEAQIEGFKKTLDASVTPAIYEIKETTAKFRQLMDAVQTSVENYAMISMAKKVSPKLAGIKLGLDLALKAYNNYQAVNKKRS